MPRGRGRWVKTRFEMSKVETPHSTRIKVSGDESMFLCFRAAASDDLSKMMSTSRGLEAPEVENQAGNLAKGRFGDWSNPLRKRLGSYLLQAMLHYSHLSTSLGGGDRTVLAFANR